jgi:hypothetical protein
VAKQRSNIASSSTESGRFESKPSDFVAIPAARLVYIGVKSREAFDKLDLPCQDHGETESGHVLTKVLGDYLNGVTVVFQHWIKQLTIETMYADAKAKEAANG